MLFFQHRKTGLCRYILQLIGQSTPIWSMDVGWLGFKEGSSDKQAVGSNTLIYVVHFRVQLEDSLSVQAVSYELAMVIICGLYPSPMIRACFLLHKAFRYL